MQRALAPALLLCGLAAAPILCAQTPAARPVTTGFLTPAQMPDVTRIIPAPPGTSDSRFSTDMAVYRATRALEGSPRWKLAQSDDDVSNDGLFKAFACALGGRLTRENAPLTTALVASANVDSNRASNTLKQFDQHLRPFQVEDRQVCVTAEEKERLSRSPDYPSGHTTMSWEAGLVLSDVAPEHASAILTRAREYGESRVVCGVHNLSAVQAGWLTAATVFAVQQQSSDFQEAVKAARVEFEHLKLERPNASTCDADAAALQKDPY
ncbi:MAG TPA: phosphatase PAP2 family protein [Vicinamibacterales bacterium]|nr:phosphatase PAP2 family protein [Vicinamibacterales bacterium]